MIVKILTALILYIIHAIWYIEEKGVNKYLVFDSTNENKKLIKKYNDVFNGIRNKIGEIKRAWLWKKFTWKLNLIQMMTYH